MGNKIIMILFLTLSTIIMAEKIEKKISKERYDELGNKKIHTFFFDAKGLVSREEERSEANKLLKIYKFLEYSKTGKIKKVSLDNWETGKITKLDFYYNGKDDLEKVIEKDQNKNIVRISEFFIKDGQLVERVRNGKGKEIKILSYNEFEIENITKSFYKEKKEIKNYVKKINIEKKEKFEEKEDPYYEYYKLEDNMEKNRMKKIAESNLEISNSNIYSEETLLAQLVTDGMKDYSRANIVFINSGIIKKGIKKGEISYFDIENMIKENQNLSYFKIKGEILDAFFKKSYEKLIGTNFLNSSGISYNKVDGKIKVEGFYLDPYKEYMVACNSDIYKFDGEYIFLKGKVKEIKETKINIKIILAEYLEEIEYIDNGYIIEKREE